MLRVRAGVSVDREKYCADLLSSGTPRLQPLGCTQPSRSVRVTLNDTTTADPHVAAGCHPLP